MSSREGLTRHWVLSQFTVARQHFQSKMPRWKNCTRKVTFQDVTVNTMYSRGTSKPMRNGVDSFDTAFTEIPCGNSACGCRLRSAASERKANISRLNRGALVSICNWLDTHESRNCLRGRQEWRTPPDSRLKTLHTLNVILVLILFNFFDSCTTTR